MLNSFPRKNLPFLYNESRSREKIATIIQKLSRIRWKEEDYGDKMNYFNVGENRQYAGRLQGEDASLVWADFAEERFKKETEAGEAAHEKRPFPR